MKIRCAMLAIVGLAGAAQAQYFTEGFDSGTTGLPAGWVSVNNSPGGPGINPNWNMTQSVTVFGPQSGAGYATANFNSSTGANDISNYMISPLVTFNNGDTISFWSRTVNTPSFPDRLVLTYNTTGSTLPADFTNTLLTINPTLTTAGYPNTWTQFSATITGLGGPTNGRFAFWYNPTTGGPSGANSDYIGVDNVVFAPAPGAAALLGLGGLVAARRRR